MAKLNRTIHNCRFYDSTFKNQSSFFNLCHFNTGYHRNLFSHIYSTETRNVQIIASYTPCISYLRDDEVLYCDFELICRDTYVQPISLKQCIVFVTNLHEPLILNLYDNNIPNSNEQLDTNPSINCLITFRLYMTYIGLHV